MPTLREVERAAGLRAVLDAIERWDGSFVRAAVDLGVDLTTLYRWVRRHRIARNPKTGKWEAGHAA